jgi:RimJ/RimL family protein N-acetyltransferase
MIELRRFTRADFPRLISWVPDARFLLQWAGPAYTFPLDEKQLADNQWEAETENPGKFLFKAVEISGEQAIGHIELVRHRDDPQKGRLARVLIGPPEKRSKGYGYAMIRQTVRFGFAELGLAEIDLAVFSFNHGALACYRRIGFQPSEFIEEAGQFGNETWSGYRMKMTREEWFPADGMD